MDTSLVAGVEDGLEHTRKIGQEPGATYQGESGICLPENIFIILYFLYLRARNYKITSGNNQGCVREQPCTLVKVYC